MAGYGRLSPGELAKTNAQTGKLRLDILRQVMQDGQEIPTITGEMIVVPKGVMHKPFAIDECKVMLVEPRGVLNTGDARWDLTAPNDRWI